MVGVLATGVALATIHVERWPPLLGTRYGYLLLGKIACIAAVLVLAARDRGCGPGPRHRTRSANSRVGSLWRPALASRCSHWP
jgi:putative copper export protein